MKSEDLSKKLLAILLILCSVAVIIIAFVGIYMPKLNKLKNIIPGYKLGTDVDGIIEYRLNVDDSEEEKKVYVDSKGNIRGEYKGTATTTASLGDEMTETEDNQTTFEIETRNIRVNPIQDLSQENFEKSKEIFAERLENAGATEYAIRLDNTTGNMVIELSQNDDIDYLYQVALTALGQFDIIDEQTGVVLIDKSHVTNFAAVSNYDETTSSYSLYLQVELDEEGGKLLTEISKQYIQYTSEGESKTDYISIRVDGESIMKTYFGEPYEQNILNIPISQNVAAKDLEDYAKSIRDIAFALNQEEIPVKYVADGNASFIGADINENIMTIFYWTIVSALVIIFIIFAVMFKKKGLLAGVLNAAVIGLLVLVLKYAKVVISISSMVAVYGVITLNFVFLLVYLRRLASKEESSYLETMKYYYSIIFPVIVIAFIFTFFVNATITGLGSVLFWGLLIQILYNTLIAKYLLEGK